MKIQRGGLYLANLNPNYGTEAGKLRPVVVIQNDLLNHSGHPSTWVVPCTTQLTPPNILRVHLAKGCSGNREPCDAMMDQSRTIDNRRFKKFLGNVPSIIFQKMLDQLRLIGDF